MKPIIFMGTPSLSIPFLEALLKEGIPISCVITQPDRPKGRGLKRVSPPVKEFALQHGLKVLQPPRLRDPELIRMLHDLHPEYIIVVAYGKIIPREILNIPEKGCINIHPSLLPEYRGPSPIQQAILDGKTKTGITVMFLSEEMDEGDIILQEEIEIDRTDTAATLTEKVAKKGPPLLIKALRRLESGDIRPVPQRHEMATYTHLIKKEEGLIRWEDSAEVIHNKVRAYNPWPGAFTYYKGKRWILWKVDVIKDTYPHTAPGEIVHVSDKGITVATGEGAIRIIELQEEGKKKLPVDVYLRGHEVQIGTRLTPGR